MRPSECLRSRRRRRPRQCRRSTRRPTAANISRRPDAVNDRREGGHWEGDQIIGANNRSSMIWLTERQGRYLIPVTMPDGYTADAALGGLIEGFDTIPDRLRRSVTFDQGPGWANWTTPAAHYSIYVWFCDHHSPRQRGQIENLNRQARWWFPRVPTSASSPLPKQNTPQTSSTTSAAAASTTEHQQNCTLPSPCTDH